MNEAISAWRDRCVSLNDKAFRVTYDTLNACFPSNKVSNTIIASAISGRLVRELISGDCAHCDKAEPIDHLDLALGHEWEPKYDA